MGNILDTYICQFAQLALPLTRRKYIPVGSNVISRWQKVWFNTNGATPEHLQKSRVDCLLYKCLRQGEVACNERRVMDDELPKFIWDDKRHNQGYMDVIN